MPPILKNPEALQKLSHRATLIVPNVTVLLHQEWVGWFGWFILETSSNDKRDVARHPFVVSKVAMHWNNGGQHSYLTKFCLISGHTSPPCLF